MTYSSTSLIYGTVTQLLQQAEAVVGKLIIKTTCIHVTYRYLASGFTKALNKYNIINSSTAIF